MADRCAQVESQRPKRLNGTDYPASVQLYVVEAKEINPPTGKSPVHWRLLTTHRVVGIEQALQVVQWYSWRWKIEQLEATRKVWWVGLGSHPSEIGYSSALPASDPTALPVRPAAAQSQSLAAIAQPVSCQQV